MSPATHHIPRGLPAVIPQLVVKDARALIEFAVSALGAQHGHVMPGPDGKGVMHGMFTIGGAPIFVSDAGGFATPTSANLFVYVPDVDATFARATSAGAKALAPVADMFWGDRYAKVADPFGHEWGLATHKEDLSAREIGRRAEAFFSRMGAVS